MPSFDTLLTKYPAHVWLGHHPAANGPRLSTGLDGLDQLIGGGWLMGSLVEILAAGPGLGELSLLMPAIAHCTHRGRGAFWLPAEALPYAPALQQAEVNLAGLCLVATADERQRLWAAEQCLRSGACDLVLIAGLKDVPLRNLRRLKLAAAAGGSIAFLHRGERTAAQPSPADMRLRVRRLPGPTAAIQVSVLKCRGQSIRTVQLRLPGH